MTYANILSRSSFFTIRRWYFCFAFTALVTNASSGLASSSLKVLQQTRPGGKEAGKTKPTEQGSRKDGDNRVLVMARWQRRTDADDVAVNAWPGGGTRRKEKG